MSGLPGPKGPILAVIPTPLPNLPTVDLFQHTWDNHISKHKLAESIDAIAAVVREPRAIVPGTGTGRPGHVIFVGAVPVRDGGKMGSPMTVVVNTFERFVCTAHPNQKYRVISEADVIWPPK